MSSRPRRARRARRWFAVALVAACACALVARARVVDASASSNVERARARLREARISARGDVDDAAVDDDDDDDDDEEEPGFRADDDGDDDDGDGFIGTYDRCDTCEACALGDAPDGVALNAPRRRRRSGTCTVRRATDATC